jgi:redox-sensing transcriptional repressor
LDNKEISKAVINRLPRYYRYLGDLLEKDVVRISSKELSEKMKVTASQIRQDLNNFGGFGQQGYGYNVEYLHSEIGKILGLEKKYNVIIIGAGNLGQALANYVDFERRGFIIKAIFDISPNLIGTKIRGIEVLSPDFLEEYIRLHSVDIAAITVPKTKAPQLAADLVKWGITGIWNFAPTDLNLPKEVTVENVHLAESLMKLSYKLSVKDRKME